MSKQLTDKEVINCIKKSKMGRTFNLIYVDGECPQDIIEYTDSEDRAIGRLIFYLLFYTQDKDQMKRILRQSKFAEGREYTDTYLDTVITRSGLAVRAFKNSKEEKEKK